MNDKPLVSVIITTYRRPKMLQRALKSVLLQNYSNIEILVIDDASGDDTEEIVNSIAIGSQFPIRFISSDTNRGACHARNLGIKAANGDFIAGLDDDDEFEINRVKDLVEHYNDQYSLVTTNTTVISKTGTHLLFKDITDRVISLDEYLWENKVGTQCLVRKDRLLECGGFDEKLTSAQDADMWLRLIERYGPALRLRKSGYILHTEHEEARISTSTKKVKGLSDYRDKHKSKMDKHQISYANFKVNLWANDHKLNFEVIKCLTMGSLFFIVKKKLGCFGFEKSN